MIVVAVAVAVALGYGLVDWRVSLDRQEYATWRNKLVATVYNNNKEAFASNKDARDLLYDGLPTPLS